MKNDAQLLNDVQNAIKREPELIAAEIGVTSKDGVISLTGIVDSYVKKLEAEHAAKKVNGVKALVENIEVRFPSSWIKSNSEVAHEVLIALKNNWSLLKDKVTVEVEDGWVTLNGELPWNYQKEAAKNAVKHITGVKGVTNTITIKSDIQDAIEQQEVEHAIARSWPIDSGSIQVKVSGTTVTLTGAVDSWYQKEEAERIAWKTPGIRDVVNELAVGYSYANIE